MKIEDVIDLVQRAETEIENGSFAGVSFADLVRDLYDLNDKEVLEDED